MSFFVASHLAIVPVVGLLFSLPFIMPLALQLLLVGLAFTGYGLRNKNDKLGFDLSAIALTLTPAVLVYMFQGHPWQIDIHLYFFATLAMVTGFKSIRTVFIASLAVALHHLSLNFLYPSLIFPTGADFSRVLLHAFIVIAEAGVILLIVNNLNKNDERLASENQKAQEALAMANAAKEEQERLEKEAEITRKKALSNFADEFQEQIGVIVEQVFNASETLTSLASDLKSSVDVMSDKSVNASSSTEEASTNVQAMASASEQLSASIREIAQNVSSASQTVTEAVSNTKASQESLNDLQKAVSEIDSVIMSINDVAEQTNLLALNATIEAARAGEAGKGFAVVASEVKSLATETGKMTDEISAKINYVRQSAENTINSFQEIIARIESINEKTTMISGAVEEQASATGEINRSANQAAEGSSSVARLISDLQGTAGDISQSTDMLNQSASSLNEQANSMSRSIEEFLNKVRA